jgi:hypothetical protein
MKREDGRSRGLMRFMRFMREEPVWWLVPILIAILAVGALVLFGEDSQTPPLTYRLF